MRKIYEILMYKCKIKFSFAHNGRENYTRLDKLKDEFEAKKRKRPTTNEMAKHATKDDNVEDEEEDLDLDNWKRKSAKRRKI